MRESATRGKVSLKTKLAFSTGALEEAMIAAATIATMLFYNQVLGVSPLLCGYVFLTASIFDAITDPLVGWWSDHFKSKWGRRHPFMLFSVIPLTVGFYLMYAPPSDLTEIQYFWWFMGTMILLRIGKTFYGIPHDALGAELTDDYHERTTIFGFNAVAGMLAGALLGAAVLIVIFPTTTEYENGLLNPERYPLLASVGAVWICLTLLICVSGTRDQIPFLHSIEKKKVDMREYLQELWALIRNPSYLSLCTAWLVMLVSGGILAVVSTYTFIYCFELSTEKLAIQRFVLLPGIFIALPLAAWLTRKLDKKLTVIYTCIVCATLVALPYSLRMIGWFPENDSQWMLWMLFGSLFLGFLALPVIPIVIDSQLADIADDHEYRTGRRSEGVIFSIRTFALKATAGFGGLVGAFGLEYINFPDNATAATLTPETINGLLFMSGPLYWMIVAVGMLFMGMYQLTEKRHKEIMTELSSRRAARDDDASLNPAA